MGEDMIAEELEGTPAQATGHVCEDCGEHIVYTEECVLVQVVTPQLFSGKPYFYPLINEQDAHGSFRFNPCYFCFRCWEDNYEGLRTETQDTPPIEDALSAFECICCGSGIREWEPSGTFTVGEFHRSRRSPNYIRGPVFTPSGRPEILCACCVAMFNDVQVEVWTDMTDDLGYCLDCLQMRCWRITDTCDCDCHVK